MHACSCVSFELQGTRAARNRLAKACFVLTLVMPGKNVRYFCATLLQ